MYNLEKKYADFQGVDLTSTAMSIDDAHASDMLNAEYDLDDRIRKRKGFQYKNATGVDMAQGAFSFRRVNPTTSESEVELLLAGQSLHRVKETDLAISYSGAATTVTADLYYDDSASQFRFTLTADGVAVLNTTLNKGFDEASTKTVAQLATQINATSGFTATTSGTTSVPAAFLDVVSSFDLKNYSLTLTANYLETIGSLPQFFHDDERTENISHVELHGNLYFGGEELYKYDGNAVYQAGMDDVDPPTLAVQVSAGSGLDTSATYKYRWRKLFKDNVGNLIYGPLSDEATATIGGSASQVQINAAYMTHGHCGLARLNGAQNLPGSGIVVDAGHTLQAGDIVWGVNDGKTTGTQRRFKVTATTATTLNLSADDDITTTTAFSDNLVLTTQAFELYRTEGGASIEYYVGQFPCALGIVGVEHIFDRVADATIVANGALEEPAYSPGLPPAGKYVTKFQDTLVLCGAPVFLIDLERNWTSEREYNTFHWADVEFIEGFPSDGSHQADVEAKDGAKISGSIGTDSSLLIFQEPKGIKRVSGDIGTGQIVVETVTEEIGCLSHASIQEFKGNIVFLSDRGVAEIAGGAQWSTDLGYKIRAAFTEVQTSPYQRFKTKRSVGFSDAKNERYILYVPCEGGDGTETGTGVDLGDGVGAPTYNKLYSNSNSRIFVLDGRKPRWLVWSNLNMAGGIAFYDDSLWWLERKWSSYNNGIRYKLARELRNDHARDYEDHNEAISWEYATSWNHFGEPKIPKQYLRLSPDSIYKTTGNDFDLTVEQEVSFVETVRATMTIDMANSSTWGVKAKTKLLDGKFTGSRFRFKNSAHNTNVDLEGWTLEVALPFKPQVKT